MKKYVEISKLTESLETVAYSDTKPESAFNEGFRAGLRKAARMLQDAPAADVIPARYGEWVHSEGGEAHCSECGCTVYGAELSPYCPHCGANMEADA